MMIRTILESDLLKDLHEEVALRAFSTCILFALWMLPSALIDIYTGIPTNVWVTAWVIIPFLLGQFGPEIYRLSWRNQMGLDGSDIMKRFSRLSREDKSLFGGSPKDVLIAAQGSDDQRTVRLEYTGLLNEIDEKNRVKEEAFRVRPDLSAEVEAIRDRKKYVATETQTYRELT